MTLTAVYLSWLPSLKLILATSFKFGLISPTDRLPLIFSSILVYFSTPEAFPLCFSSLRRPPSIKRFGWTADRSAEESIHGPVRCLLDFCFLFLRDMTFRYFSSSTVNHLYGTFFANSSMGTTLVMQKYFLSNYFFFFCCCFLFVLFWFCLNLWHLLSIILHLTLWCRLDQIWWPIFCFHCESTWSRVIHVQLFLKFCFFFSHTVTCI